MEFQQSSSANTGGLVISLTNVYQQRFDFPSDVIKHILAKASYNVVKKLYFTCKYFPSKYRLFLIDGIRFGKVHFTNDIFATTQQAILDAFFARINKIWIGEYISTTVISATKWFPKIEKCTIKKLEVLHEDLLWNDFKMLAKEETIEEISVKKILYSAASGDHVATEDICVLIPNVNSLEIVNTHVTEKSMKKLCNVIKSTKINKFVMFNIDNLLNGEDYLKFLQKYGCHDSDRSFSLFFSQTLPLNGQTEFISTVSSEIEEWPEPRPSFHGIYPSF